MLIMCWRTLTHQGSGWPSPSRGSMDIVLSSTFANTERDGGNAQLSSPPSQNCRALKKLVHRLRLIRIVHGPVNGTCSSQAKTRRLASSSHFWRFRTRSRWWSWWHAPWPRNFRHVLHDVAECGGADYLCPLSGPPLPAPVHD